MKIKFLSALILAGTVSVSAQGFKDGIDYFNAGDIEDAAIILNRAINDPATDKAQANYYLGLIALNDGKTSDATKFFNAGIEANASDPFNYIGLGAIDLKNNNPKAAEQNFKKAKDFAKKSKNAAAITEIARTYYNANPDAYAKDIEKNIAEAFKMSKNEEPTTYILQADMVAKTDPGDAAGKYDMAMAFDWSDNGVIDNPEAYVKYARTYFRVNPQYAIDRLKELLQRQPNSAMAQRELAEKYYDNNQLTRAAEQYGEYIKNPNHFQKDEQRYVGLLYFGKKYQQSFDLAQKILAKDPGNIYMQRMELLTQAAMEKYPEAEKYAKEFFSNPAAKGKFVTNDYITYGNVLQELNRPEEAIALYEEALRLSPDKASIYQNLSSAYSGMKEYQKAVDAYQQYIDKTENPSVNDLFELATSYENLSRTTDASDPNRKAFAEKALEIINRVTEKAPSNISVARHKAFIMYLAAGDKYTPEVVDAYKYTIALLDKDPANAKKSVNNYVLCYTNLGMAAINDKDFPTAKSYFQKALEYDPSNEQLQNYVKQLK